MNFRVLLSLSLPVVFTAALGCSAETTTDTPEAQEQLFEESRCEDAAEVCDRFGRVDPANRAPAYELGDGTKEPTLTVVYQGPENTQPIDVEFNPRSPRELWIAHYASSHFAVVNNPGTKNAEVIARRDIAYGHFAYRPPGFAFGTIQPEFGQQFGICGDNNNGGNKFMGPTLFTANLEIYGIFQNPETRLGSHLDMLHSTSFCRGITWAGTGNQYILFNSDQGSIDWYDFRKDHGLGWEDHSDGVIRRFWNRQVKGVDGLVSHLSWNAQDNLVYVADTGNKRILVLDTTDARMVAPLPGVEPIAERAYFEAPLKVLVDTGLEAPSGIEANGGLAFVTDALTSKIHAFDLKTGELVRTLDTHLPPASLAGLNFGPDGKIYFVDRLTSRVLRIDP